MKLKLILILLFVSPALYSQTVVKEIKITHKYLNMPVESSQDRQTMTFVTDGTTVRKFVIRLSNGHPDYWVFPDVSEFQGETLTISYPLNVSGFNKIYQSDKVTGQRTTA